MIIKYKYYVEVEYESDRKTIETEIIDVIASNNNEASRLAEEKCKKIMSDFSSHSARRIKLIKNEPTL